MRDDFSPYWINNPVWDDFFLFLCYNPEQEDFGRTGLSMEFLPPTKPRRVDGRIRDAADLGDTIRERRKQLGLTQIQLAKSCGCSPRFIGELERGVAGGNIKQVIAVCREIGIDLYANVRGA